MSSGLEIRSATGQDASAVADVYIRSRETHVLYAPLIHDHNDISCWISEVLLPSGSVRVATIESVIVGLIATSSENGADWIDQLYIAPDQVSRGIGTALIRDVLGRLARPVRLRTFQANGGARRFYKRHGFKEIEHTDGQDNEERCPRCAVRNFAEHKGGVQVGDGGGNDDWEGEGGAV